MKIQPASKKIKARIAFLVFNLLLLSLTSVVLSNYVLYRIALNQAGEMLGYASKNNVRFLEYLSHHEEEEAKQRHIPYNPDDTLAIFRQQLEADDYLHGGNQ